MCVVYGMCMMNRAYMVSCSCSQHCQLCRALGHHGPCHVSCPWCGPERWGVSPGGGPPAESPSSLAAFAVLLQEAAIEHRAEAALIEQECVSYLAGRSEELDW